MDAGPGSQSIVSQLLLLLFFTMLNAFFAGAEMAVVSVNKNKIRTLAEEGNKKAKIIQGLFEDSTKFLSTIQVAITFAGFFSSASAASGLSPYVAQWLKSMHIPYATVIAQNGVTLILMFFNLVLGELVPKRVAMQKAETFCMMTVMPIHYISIVLSPFIKLLSISTKGVLRLMRMSTEDPEEVITRDEIKAMLKSGFENGTVDNTEREMINSVFAFDDKTAREVMVPRQRVVSIEISDSVDEIIDEILESRHSRIPVYEDDIDNIIGIFYAKEIVIRLRKGKISHEELRGMLHKPYFVPEMRDAAQLFREMQAGRVHMAILVDEYGGFSGIVTIEDLVEEIMGDINEEYEDVEPDIVPVREGEFLLDGTMTLSEVNESFNLNLDSDDYDTISGLVIDRLGYIPHEVPTAPVEESGYLFAAEQIEGNTILKVSIKKIQETTSDSE